MTFFTTLFLTLLMAIVVGSGGLVLKNWIAKKSFPKKHYCYKRISAIVTPEMHLQIKSHAQELDITITEYVLSAVQDKMQREAHG